MGSSISTNLNSLAAQQSFRSNSDFQAGVIRRLTSGYRISRAGDDPAGLAVANRYRTDTGELSQGIRNLNDGISQLQIVDGGIDNISKILDRLKVLASQSASDSFVGDRNTLDSEFQTLLGEIDRQSESIGLDSGGKFAKLLSVWVGGSTGAGGTAVDIDLSAAAVDSRGLGLGGAKGMQAVAALADISPTSTTHTVAQIIADPRNTSATPGRTDFLFSGNGFSDGQLMKVPVDLQAVTTLDGLVASINSAIQVAGSGTDPGATAFKNAGIVAFSYSGQGLAFSSAATPFQVQAGDLMANALMGNLNGTSGVTLVSTVQGVNTAAGAAAFVPAGVTVRISGGGVVPPVDLKLDATANTTALAITNLKSKVSGDAQLKAAGITLSGAPGGPLTFTDARGDIFSVQVTGDRTNGLGLGSFAAGASGAADYTSIQGTAYDNTISNGIAHLELSIAGAPSIAVPNIDLAGGDAVPPNSRSGADLQKALNDAINANPALQAAGLSAKFAGGALTIASSNGTYFRVNAGTSGPAADIGFGVRGVAFNSSLTVAQASSHIVDAAGGAAVASLSFKAMSYGGAPQTIVISAPDADGRLQTSALTIRNDDQGRDGQNIDESIAAINAQLQLGSSTVQQILAVKENVGGEERIGFLSTLRSFQVTVGTGSHGEGLNGGVGIIENSTAIGAQVNTSITTAHDATLALKAVIDAVSALGAVQAAVGKAENQMSYAIDLSQSQVTNFSSAESRIRDTDVAADAANLTKAQILSDAAVSAMAHANSAAESVLTLLRG